MTPLQIVYELEKALQTINTCINFCYDAEVDYSFLFLAEEALTNQIAGIKQTLAYKMEQYEAYGEPLDETGVESVQALIEEIGYDQVREAFGDSVDAVLSESVEEVYRV